MPEQCFQNFVFKDKFGAQTKWKIFELCHLLFSFDVFRFLRQKNNWFRLTKKTLRDLLVTLAQDLRNNDFIELL